MRVPAAALVVLFLAGACQSPSPPAPPSAEAVVDSAIAAHGGPVLDSAAVQFSFRDDRYRLVHRGGLFHYRRSFVDSLGRGVVEGLTNEAPYRVVEGDTTTLGPDERTDVTSTVNSVAYFALLPRPLNDPSVQPTYTGRDTIDGVPYHRVRVTFRQEGGGQDWQDVFLYWFRTDTYAMEYLSYAYGLGPDEETGTRFREAYNVRRRQGVRFADYRNYTADTLAADQMHRYPSLLSQDRLRLVSRVALDSVRVRSLSSGSS